MNSCFPTNTFACIAYLLLYYSISEGFQLTTVVVAVGRKYSRSSFEADGRRITGGKLPAAVGKRGWTPSVVRRDFYISDKRTSPFLLFS